MNMTAIYSFIGGVVVGGLVSLFVADKILRADYDKKCEEEQAAIKRYYETKADISAKKEEEKQKNESQEAKTEPFMDILTVEKPEEPKISGKTQYSSYATKPIDTDSQEFKDLMKEVDGYSSESYREARLNAELGPFVLPEKDFRAGNYPVDYGEEGLTYYDEENALYNADREQLYDGYDLVGHCLDDFCEPDEEGKLPSEMFIQNDRERMIYILTRE